jgi:TRIAD3 protein (E3 ubiquitin-protein ligase RNF216)
MLNGSLPIPRRFFSPQAMPLFLASDEDEPPYHEPFPFALPFAPLPIPVVQDIPEKASSPEPIPKPVTPPPDIDPMDAYVARVLEIIPDVQPAHVHTLLMQRVDIHKDGAVELVLHDLFEDSSYPKIDKKGKRKREEVDNEGDERGLAKTKIDYGDKDRVHSSGPFYVDIALEQLLLDFPYIPKPHVRKVLFNNKALYAPTYLFLAEEKERKPLPYNVKTVPSRVTGKGKAMHDPDFDKEREWLLLKLQGDIAHNDAQVAEEMNEQEYEDSGNGIECGCCFSTYPFDKMIQCPDCHLFCSNCMTSYASGLLGAHDPDIVCMDQSGCKLAFPESELRRFLTPKLLELYERVKLRKEIETAGLENLEECPFCEYKVVIENKDEKLFRCESEDCGAVTCRECKKPDHLPKSCKEMEEDKHLDARHAIEEAMTHALMRNCPNCQKAFIKEYGCNKMTCPNCQTMSCYICRKIISGYEHFDQRTYTGPTNSKKCMLSDPVEQRHTEEVTKAAKEALEDYKRQHPNMDQEELKAIEVDLPPSHPPPAPVAGPVNPFAMPRMGMPMGFAQAQMAHAAQMQQFMAQPPPQPNPAFFNFNINFEQMLPRVAPPMKRRGRRR